MFICGIIVLYIILGFLAFIWNAKRTHLTYFDNRVMLELMFLIAIGPLAFIILSYVVLIEKFKNFMDELLKKINE